ncbi:MAG TPA: aspartyl protease family protein [Blastocatellia bacterium]|nr:aspartyl protease family protein [Blastocatellia bacterium]
MNLLISQSDSRVLIGIVSLVALSLGVLLYGNAQEVRRSNTPAGESHKDYRFAAGRSALRIPFEEDDGHIFLQARINDSPPLWFGLDTGAIRSVIDRGRAQSLGLRFEGRQQVGGAGGTEEALIIKGISVKLPGVELSNQTAWALPLEALSVANGREMAGIIGYELFSHFVVDVDYAAKYINLYEPQGYRYRGSGENIPLTLRDGEIYVPAKVTVAGHDVLEGQFVIDTGSNNTLMLAKSFVEDHKLLDSIGKTLPARGGGVGGEIQIAMGRATNLRLGHFVVNNPVTAFIKVGEIAEPGMAGNIGGRLLRRFRVIFDYSRRRMILEPNVRFPEAEEFDMSGAALISEGPAFTIIKVVRARPNSPAAEAGLLPQDIITAVDGRPASTLTLSGLRKMFREDGRAYLLSVMRNEQVFQIRLRLRKLI